MKLTVVQFKPEFGKIAENSRKIKNYLNAIDQGVVVFPELSLSGYDIGSRNEALELGDEVDSPLMQEFQHIASEKGLIINFGFIEKNFAASKERVYNSSALLFPDASLSSVYRKVHLFFRERFVFDYGDKGFFVVRDEQRDINIGPMICYDWRFPEASRSLALKGADLISMPSNLVTKSWHLAMPARALENKIYIAVSNRVGTENRNNAELYFNGKSAIYSYNGEAIIIASETDEEVITSEIDPAKTRKKSFNDYNDIFKDRRPEQYYLG